MADLLLAAAFLVWGGMLVAPLFGGRLSSQLAAGLRLLAIVPQLFAAVLMVMALYEEEKRRVERNMLALSNLNLATSSFVGGEIQRMLTQTLDRVLRDRKSTRLNSSHLVISYAVFCLKKKKKKNHKFEQ